MTKKKTVIRFLRSATLAASVPALVAFAQPAGISSVNAEWVFDHQIAIPAQPASALIISGRKLYTVVDSTALLKKAPVFASLVHKLVDHNEPFEKSWSRQVTADGQIRPEFLQEVLKAAKGLSQKQLDSMRSELLEMMQSAASAPLVQLVKSGAPYCSLELKRELRDAILESGAVIHQHKSRLEIRQAFRMTDREGSLTGNSFVQFSLNSKGFSSMLCSGVSSPAEIAQILPVTPVGIERTVPVLSPVKLSATEMSLRDSVQNDPSMGYLVAGDRVRALRASQIGEFATQVGVSPQAVRSYQQVGRIAQGQIFLAGDRAGLGQSINSVLGLIKARASSSDTLELVFALDYSGSMADDIEGVITNLDHFIQALGPVIESGRQVKVGIVTFGSPGQEQVNLQLTSDLANVRGVLAKLFRNYDRDQHSIDPGEASISGLIVAADPANIEWKSSNRSVLLITDEPAYEVEIGDQAKLNRAQQMLSRNGVDVFVYPILVR